MLIVENDIQEWVNIFRRGNRDSVQAYLGGIVGLV